MDELYHFTEICKQKSEKIFVLTHMDNFALSSIAAVAAVVSVYSIHAMWKLSSSVVAAMQDELGDIRRELESVDHRLEELRHGSFEEPLAMEHTSTSVPQLPAASQKREVKPRGIECECGEILANKPKRSQIVDGSVLLVFDCPVCGEVATATDARRQSQVAE